MKKRLLQIIILVTISATISACKLDAPILPGQAGYVEVKPPGGGDTTGTGGITTPIDNAALTGTWKMDLTNTIVYTDGVPNTSDAISLFTDVQMDDAAKTTIFDGQFTLPSDEVSYVLSTSNGKTYLQFSEDVFQRSSNGPVQITSFTGTTMTWVALDPLSVTSAGHKIQSAWQVTFTKQ